ncbi:MAG TPA: hypothetical protein PLL50_02945 [Propionicimonas sp.]|nr:hypothetical protein [Propionicimonas sp.]HQA77296.1 hypothetical protein [Propionicimonas sp.]HQD97247.1 hypothetical protein [Propionicimonas sp.]
MPKSTPNRPAVGGGSLRARARLLAVVLLTMLTVLFAVMGLRLYLAPPVDALSGSLYGFVALMTALAYGLSARWVAIQRRWGHLVALAVVVLGAVLGLTANMTWLEWAMLGANVLALACLAASIPRKSATTSPRKA